MEEVKKKIIEEKIIEPKSGWVMLCVVIVMFLLFPLAIVGVVLNTSPEVVVSSVVVTEESIEPFGVFCLVAGILDLFIAIILSTGFKIINPNEAIVLTLFGKYYGTIANEGFFWVNPFTSAFAPAVSKDNNKKASSLEEMAFNTAFPKKKISLKAMTLVNDKQKVNDEEGNPIEIGVVVIWRIINTAKAVFNVDDYTKFISTQADSAIRHVARQYPYDMGENEDEEDTKTLRASSQEVADELKTELQKRVDISGIEIMEARISHLAYAPEIAAAMLQRQQAKAIIVARQKIVDGAVGMVDMALKKLSDNNIVDLDDERKAQMVCNLLVVLCGNKDAQPIVNSGSIY